MLQVQKKLLSSSLQSQHISEIAVLTMNKPGMLWKQVPMLSS